MTLSSYNWGELLMDKNIAILVATSALALLSACGGGGGGSSDPLPPASGGGTPAPPPRYETLDSAAAKTSTLGGVALRSNGTSGALDVVTTSGRTTHNTGNTIITDGTYSLTDVDGFNGGNALTDRISTITADLASGYEYATAYDQSYQSGGVTYDSRGVAGVVISGSDMPKTGSATYSGDAQAQVVVAAQGFDLSNGKSTVSADFATGRVDVTMTGFTATDQKTGNAATAPIDTISATGMSISGNGFSGGTVTTSNAGTTVNVTGANTTTTAQGAFFGYDAAASAPDEVGGLTLQKGDDGIVTGGFIAD